MMLHGIFSVYIDDDFSDDIQSMRLMDHKVKFSAINTISKASIGMPIILFNNFAVLDQRCIHAMNVCVISIVLAAFRGVPA